MKGETRLVDMERLKADTLIIDGRHALWRSCDAFSELCIELENGEEIGTGGMYGFLTILGRIHGRYGGKVIVAWEGRNNFRLQIYKPYKKKDIAPDQEKIELVEEMGEQERRLKALLRLIGVEQYEADGFEADDVIGTLAERHRETGRVVIYSGDGDLRQLVKERVVTVSPGFRGGNDTIYASHAAVKAKDGVGPDLIPDLKALSGDSSDNIPGIHGIGPQTACKALIACGSLESVIEAAEAGSDMGIPERFRKSIIEGKENLALYKRLTTIVKDAKMTSIKPTRDPKRLRSHFMAYKFRSLVMPVEWMGLMRIAGERETEKA